MTNQLAEIILTPAPNGFSGEWEYELREDAGFLVNGHQVLVPKFFSYDGATIPPIAWHLIYSPFDPIVMRPALLHDWLYTTHEVSREEADQALASELLWNGAPELKVRIIHTAVSTLGAHFWEHSETDKHYIDWLKSMLTHDGRDPAIYHLP